MKNNVAYLQATQDSIFKTALAINTAKLRFITPHACTRSYTAKFFIFQTKTTGTYFKLPKNMLCLLQFITPLYGNFHSSQKLCCGFCALYFFVKFFKLAHKLFAFFFILAFSDCKSTSTASALAECQTRTQLINFKHFSSHQRNNNKQSIPSGVDT